MLRTHFLYNAANKTDISRSTLEIDLDFSTHPCIFPYGLSFSQSFN